MSFFVKCPNKRPVQGRFKKVQMYGAIRRQGHGALHHFETAHYCEYRGHYKKRHTHAPIPDP